MRDGAEVMDELVHIGEQIRRAEATVHALKMKRDDLIFEANEIHVVPISTISTALGVRRDTVVSGKLKSQARQLQERWDSGAA